MPVPIKHNDRVFIQGKTDSGKTVLARHLFDSFDATRRTCIDPKGRIVLPGIVPARTPAELDLAAPVSHYIPSELEDEEYEELFRLLWFAGGPRLIHLDESAGPTRAGWAPKYLRFVIQQGRERDIGLIACSQRPVNVESTLRSEAEHVFMFVPRTTKKDVETMAGDIGREPAEIAGQLDSLLAEEGLWSHLWYARNTNELNRCAPLPASWVHQGPDPPSVDGDDGETATQAAEEPG
jgi:hypothetical protein